MKRYYTIKIKFKDGKIQIYNKCLAIMGLSMIDNKSISLCFDEKDGDGIETIYIDNQIIEKMVVFIDERLN